MKVLIVGLGSIAAKHIAALKQLYPDAEIYALRSGEGKTEQGITSIYHLADLKVKPDFVIISNPTNLHLKTILSVATLKVPLFIEKPPLDTLTGADAAGELLKQQQLITYVACNLRFHPCLQFLKSYLDTHQTTINEVNIYCGSYLPDWRPEKDFRTMYSANADMGGGVHLDLFHEMDYTCWLFGFPETARGFQSNHSSLGINAADYANYLLNYPAFSISVILNYYRRQPKRNIEILFNTGTWVVDLLNCTILTDSGETIYASPNFNIMDTYVEQLKYFIDCIEHKKKPMNTFNEALKVLTLSLQNG